jgi:xanthosine utilization system XapX-like protein
MRRKLLALALVAAGLMLGLAYASGKVCHPFAPVMALLLFLAGGMLLPRTYEISDQMCPCLRTSVEAKAWGSGLPGFEGAAFRLHRTAAFGAGLHLYFLPEDSDTRLHLKVAQPRAVVQSEHGVEIGTAKYVQWCGKKVKRVQGEKALVLLLTATPLSSEIAVEKPPFHS